MQRSFEENLALYAKLIVHRGLAIGPGREVLVFAEIGDPRLARLVTEEAYRAGAKNVEVLWSDPDVTLAKFREGSEEAVLTVPRWLYDGITNAHRDGAARLAIISADPGLLAGIPPDRVAANSRAQSAAKKELNDLITAMQFPWCLVGAASPAWAARVFPEAPVDQAVEKLWDAIFLTSRIFEDDPIAAWSDHCDALDERMNWLNGLELSALHFAGPGTDLRVGLAESRVWEGGWATARDGTKCAPNIPTEEVFTMPHRSRVDGVVRSSKPLSVRGQIVDGIEMEFRDGVAIRARAQKGEDTLERLLSTDEGARRLGEVALVPNSSKVSQAGILFLNSLYDENAASHIAMGACYSGNMAGYDDLPEEERSRRGANDSLIHVDWMIGSDSMDVDGIRTDGSSLALMRSGEWC